ncbi:MAG: hypothetical protein Q7W55_10420 [Pseudohongiella sp.]|nr:hypothetical protein [Pseudohongiella sp.]MDP2128166.1 hypothetical protein [Pseudohongiella sp.]
MYQDTKRIRQNRVSINLDDYEAALIQALVDYTGSERATLIRDMVVAQAQAVLMPTPQSIAVAGFPLKSPISSV